MNRPVELELSKDECQWICVALCMARAEFMRNEQWGQYQEIDKLSRRLVRAERQAGLIADGGRIEGEEVRGGGD